MNYTERITSYFKQSLIDGERLCPSDNDMLPVLGTGKPTKASNAYIAQDTSIWSHGKISSDLAQKTIAEQQKPKSPPLSEVELVLLPRVDLHDYKRGWRTELKRKVLTPLCVFVRLQQDGTLLPGSSAPWIPREWLSPNSSATPSFAEFSNVDEFLTLNPYEGIETWENLVEYCEDMLATAVNYTKTEDNSSGTLLFDVPLCPEYRVSDQCLFQMEPPVVGAKAKILGALEAMLAEKTFPTLYRRFTRSSDLALKPHEMLVHDQAGEKHHVAQMTGEFALSHHQRNGLHHFVRQQSGEILTVNGPPGTGKTTLLRSIVANLWTTAALEETDPPLIVAASNNNQAVTNILESFAKVDEQGLDESLKGRWLPNLDSYGLYCCSGEITKSTPYLHMDANGKGSIRKFQNQEYVNAAKEAYLQNASIWHGSDVDNIEDAKSLLHGRLTALSTEITGAIKLKHEFIAAKSKLLLHAKSLENLELIVEGERAKAERGNKEFDDVKGCYDTVCDLWDSRSIWIHLFFWVPAIRTMEHRKTERLLSSWSDNIQVSHFSDDEISSWFKKRMSEIKQRLASLEACIKRYEAVVENYLSAQKAIQAFIEQYRPEKLFSADLLDQCSEIIDRTFRFTSFKVATHYWEARWLKEVEIYLREPSEHEKSPTTMPKRYRRHAKLTPCFVSTFYMLPAVFTAFRGEEKPLFEEIDLLIVDEAGQALAEVSAASFALARRALIVGDTDQIEPVWSVPEKIDLANLRLFGLLKDARHYEAYWKKSGLLASSGNVMRVAQRQSKYHQYEELSRGLYLTEHRRCYDTIINFCNTLVYKGVLDALRGRPKTPVPWGTMSFCEVFSASKAMGGSRVNIGEAEAIVHWLCSECETILRYAREQDEKLSEMSDADVLKCAVGIITPFNKQAKQIDKLLLKQGIKGLTVGTVHKLQGDERLIVLFSSVYGANNKSIGKFYDRGRNMLNVAVSRAKDSFIVFGNPDVFGIGASGSPSGILRGELKTLNATDGPS